MEHHRKRVAILARNAGSELAAGTMRRVCAAVARESRRKGGYCVYTHISASKLARPSYQPVATRRMNLWHPSVDN